ncbi:MAG: hypothetical protein WKF75_12220 [Singulisphaera sp.]
MTDLFPTLLAVAEGLPDPAWKVDGIDLLPAWTGRAAVPSASSGSGDEAPTSWPPCGATSSS